MSMSNLEVEGTALEYTYIYEHSLEKSWLQQLLHEVSDTDPLSNPLGIDNGLTQ